MTMLTEKFCPISSPAGNDSLTGLAVEASRKALEMAQVEPDDLDLILFCSSTPEDLFGGAPKVPSDSRWINSQQKSSLSSSSFWKYETSG